MKIFMVIMAFFLSACNTIPISSQSMTIENNTQTIGLADNSSYPLEATKFVSLHADRSLKLNRSCTQVLRLNLAQRKGYQDTITELKNRAVLMGGNSVSLVSWREQGKITILLGNIYMCKGKTFHIHPHPHV